MGQSKGRGEARSERKPRLFCLPLSDLNPDSRPRRSHQSRRGAFPAGLHHGDFNARNQGLDVLQMLVSDLRTKGITMKPAVHSRRTCPIINILSTAA